MAAAMSELNGTGCPMFMQRCRHFPVARNDCVGGAVHLPVIERVFRRNRRRTTELAEADAALGLFRVVGDVAVIDDALFDKPGRVGRAEKPVSDDQILDFQRFKQSRILCH